ncbi:hypothetical protein D3C78_1664100 [compost metagenome]
MPMVSALRYQPALVRPMWRSCWRKALFMATMRKGMQKPISSRAAASHSQLANNGMARFSSMGPRLARKYTRRVP